MLMKTVVLIQVEPMPSVKELYHGVYKTLQTKGRVGKRIARFMTNINNDRPAFHIVELDLYRGESITVTCPNRADGLDGFFPTELTSYYMTPPKVTEYLNTTSYSKTDLQNQLLESADEKLGSLDDVSDALLLINYGSSSKRLSFLWEGKKVRRPSTLYYICIKESKVPERYAPMALIAVRVIPEKPVIQPHVIDMNKLVYAPKECDLIYTKEFSPTDDLTLQCKPAKDGKVKEAWKPLDIEMLQHNILSLTIDGKRLLNPHWRSFVELVNVDVNLDDIDNGTVTVKSKSLSAMLYVPRSRFYLSCAPDNGVSRKVFQLMPNTVAIIDNIKPVAKGNDVNEINEITKHVQQFPYEVTHERTVSLLCPIETHTLKPSVLLTKSRKKFANQVRQNFPNTRISVRGDSVVVIDFSNSAATEDVRMLISCKSNTDDYTSYVFSLTNRMKCLFSDNMELWKPCKVVLFPSEELIVRCPRKSESDYYPLKPDDVRDAYIKVDDDFVMDRHAAISRTLIPKSTGGLHKITFKGHDNRALIRDEIHFECSGEERKEYAPEDNRPIVIIKLVGKFEDSDMMGNVSVPLSDLLKPVDGPRLFHVFLGGGMHHRIDCSEFFINSPQTALYPRGKTEVFDDIPPFFPGMLINKIKGRKVHATRAIVGIRMAKYPKDNPSQVELILDNDYRMSSKSDNAMYFLCARSPLWDDMHSDVAVIQIYIQSNTGRSYGVGVEKGLFGIGQDFAGNVHNDATFNISDHDMLAMHCPKEPGDKILPKCHVLKSSQIIGDQHDSDMVPVDDTITRGIVEYEKLDSIKSLWYISTKPLKNATQFDPLEVDCYCRDENNKTLVVMHLTTKSGFLRHGLLVIFVGIMLLTLEMT
ncbi:muA, putative [Babesia ovis]|uniref:MuA, putative n=1 Tax=Babesia ovis TaxID=5869 RepID=A0A9W5T9B2_BABOV|nr:muA, putative [Babesia ovis]